MSGALLIGQGVWALGLLAQAASGASTGYAYTKPFVQPLPVWDYWYLLLIPLAAAISVVYKSVKCSRASEIARESAKMCAWILVAMVGAGAGLLVVVRVLQ